MIVLSHFQAVPLLAAQVEGCRRARVSLDLNLTESEVQLSPAGVAFPSGEQLVWEQVEEIAASETACFVLQETQLEKIQRFCPETNRLYTLLPTGRAPALRVANFAMHRIKEIDPSEDTRRKVATLEPVKGWVLDTATGLGYTAIQAARTAAEVITVEIAPAVLEIARMNPWSQDLFVNPKIRPIIGDVGERIGDWEAASFDRILHDPPPLPLAGELFSEAFYRQLRRVLKRGGRMFHYIGDVTGPMGSSVAKGVVRRLQAVGFTKVLPRPEAFGVVAHG